MTINPDFLAQATKQYTVIQLVLYVATLLAIAFATKKYTSWSFITSCIVTYLAGFIIAPWIYILFSIPYKIVMNPGHLNLQEIINKSTLSIQAIAAIIALAYGAIISATSHILALKAICYFGKKTIPFFDKKFFLTLFLLYIIPAAIEILILPLIFLKVI